MWPVVQAGTSAWLADNWNPATALPRSLWALQPAGAYPFFLHGLSLESTRSVAIAPLPLALLAALVPALLASAALAIALVRRPLELVRGPIAALGWLTLGPLALMWLQSVVARPAYLVGRYDLVAWPAACLFAALLMTRACELVSDARPGIWLSAGCLALALAASLPIARFLAYENLGGWDSRRAARLAAVSGPDDLTIAFSHDADRLAYDLHRAGFEATVASFPSWLDRQIGFIDSRCDLAPERREDVERDAAAMIERMRAALERGGRVFLLDDSLHREQPDPRVGLNRVLVSATRDAGWRAVAVDGGLGIHELRENPEDRPDRPD